MRLMQLVYTSRPFGFDDLELRNILLVSRHNNERDGITGSLICREDIYLQLLEGPRAAVSSRYARILQDNRHAEIVLLWAGDAQERLFPAWFMRHDPVQSWMDGSPDGRYSKHLCPAGRLPELGSGGTWPGLMYLSVQFLGSCLGSR
jgi:hypothetical protein